MRREFDRVNGGSVCFHKLGLANLNDVSDVLSLLRTKANMR
jgi:hypothetical protein